MASFWAYYGSLILQYFKKGRRGVAKKHIKSPTHVRQVLSEQINKLRDGEVTKDEVEKARAIGYLSK